MRKLTQKEIDNRPDGTNFYREHQDGSVTFSLRDAGLEQPGHSQIPRKEFDISEYEHSHGGLKLHSIDIATGDLYLSHYGEVHRRTKEDAIAEAKHFKLTADDLK